LAAAVKSNVYQALCDVFPDPSLVVKYEYFENACCTNPLMKTHIPTRAIGMIFAAEGIVSEEKIAIYHFLSSVESWCPEVPTSRPGRAEGLAYKMLDYALTIPEKTTTP
jgi:hypothetical protein